MDSRRFIQILEETIAKHNDIAYSLNSNIWEIKNCHTPSCGLSAHYSLQAENFELKKQIQELQEKLHKTH